jgi:hypothetical protein
MTKQRPRPKAFDDYGEGPPYHMGTASPTHHDEAPEDIVALLHAVVEEVTGKPVERPVKRMGFL